METEMDRLIIEKLRDGEEIECSMCHYPATFKVWRDGCEDRSLLLCGDCIGDLIYQFFEGWEDILQARRA